MDAQYELDTTPAHLRFKFPTDDRLMLDFVSLRRPLPHGSDAQHRRRCEGRRSDGPLLVGESRLGSQLPGGPRACDGRPDPSHATKLVEAGQLCQLLNPPLRCLPAVFTDFGGIGRELRVYSAITGIQPHFQQLYEAAEPLRSRRARKSGWAARRAKQR